MTRWWCMDCRAPVKLNQQGRCGGCDSEAVAKICSQDDSTSSESDTELDTVAGQANA